MNNKEEALTRSIRSQRLARLHLATLTVEQTLEFALSTKSKPISLGNHNPR